MNDERANRPIKKTGQVTTYSAHPLCPFDRLRSPFSPTHRDPAHQHHLARPPRHRIHSTPLAFCSQAEKRKKDRPLDFDDQRVVLGIQSLLPVQLASSSASHIYTDPRRVRGSQLAARPSRQFCLHKYLGVGTTWNTLHTVDAGWLDGRMTGWTWWGRKKEEEKGGREGRRVPWCLLYSRGTGW